MSTEHVEDLLSAYLDNALAHEEHEQVALHLQTCATCNAVLADFRRFDAILKKQPRMSPGVALRERIFSSTEYLELIKDITAEQGTSGNIVASDVKNRQTLPQKRVRPDTTSHPHLVALPSKIQSPLPSKQETQVHIRTPQRRNIYIQHFMQIAIAACLLLTLGVGSFIGWNLWQQQGKTAQDAHDIIPPQAPHQGGPLPAGMRFVFLRDGGLWSTPEDGSTQAVRLTPTVITVAQHWVVNPAPSGHSAGNLLAYVDMKQGYIHTLRTDGQSDTIVKQPLLQNVSATSWNTSLGETVLGSLSWSPDGHTLAFISATAKTSTVYTYSTSTNQTQSVGISDTGAISHLVWSPNGVRIAFAITHNGITKIIDYNVLTREALTVTSTVANTQNPHDSVLMLDWTLNVAPTITWSVGTQGHIHSIWLRHVGTGDNGVRLLSSGDYTQAVYSRYGAYGTGGWLLGRTLTPNIDTILSLTLTGTVRTIASGSQLDVAQWAPDSKHVTYFEALTSDVGTLHSVDITTGVNTLVAQMVRSTPTPTWSSDGQHLFYSVGPHSFATDVQNNKTQLSITGIVSTVMWSTTSSHTVVLAIQDGKQGIYLVDIQHNTAKILSTQSVTGPIVWTQVP